MVDYASRMDAGQRPVRCRPGGVVIGFMVWGALWAYQGGPAGFVLDMVHQVMGSGHSGLSFHAGRDAVDFHVGL